MGAFPNPINSNNGGGAQPISNQFFQNIPGFANPGQSPSSYRPTGASASAPNPFMNPWQGSNNLPGGASSAGPTSQNLGHGIIATGLEFPGLSGDFANYLLSQIGQGLKPFNESTPLPTGGSTQRGQLTAGLNPLLAQLMQFYQTGGQKGFNDPGLNVLQNIAQNGVDVLPAWQSMLGAEQQNIHQNEAQLREQFAGMGDLAGSPFGTAMSNYAQQTTADQNAMLSQMTLQSILQGQIPVAQNLASGFLQGGQDLSGILQAINQQSIQNRYQEFQRTQPQNNPMMQYLAAFGSMFPPTTKTPTSFDQFLNTVSAFSGAGFNSSSGAGANASSMAVTL